jgi:hypothetical protein
MLPDLRSLEIEFAARGFLSRLRICTMSQADGILMSVSIFTPKAFSIRSAMSPDRSALPLSELDGAGRET